MSTEQTKWKMCNGNNKVWTAKGELVVGENVSEAMSKNECSHSWCHGQGLHQLVRSQSTFSCPGIWRAPLGVGRQRQSSRPPPSPSSTPTSSSPAKGKVHISVTRPFLPTLDEWFGAWLLLPVSTTPVFIFFNFPCPTPTEYCVFKCYFSLGYF